MAIRFKVILLANFLMATSAEAFASPYATTKLGGYYDGSGGSQSSYIGFTQQNGKTYTIVDQQVPYFGLSEGFASKASQSGASVSYNSQLGTSVLTQGAPLPVYAFNQFGESLGPTGQYTNNPAESAVITGGGNWSWLLLLGLGLLVVGGLK